MSLFAAPLAAGRQSGGSAPLAHAAAFERDDFAARIVVVGDFLRHFLGDAKKPLAASR